ncbi:4165_t:CDS:2, partial [Scutellospora calospora]
MPSEFTEKKYIENTKKRKKREHENDAEKENVIKNIKEVEIENVMKEIENEKELKIENSIKKVEQEPPKAKAKKVKYPIEDLEVPPDIKSMFMKKPSLRQKFNIPQECVGTMLTIWNFFTIFGKSLFLSFFNLDDFELSLCHNVASPRCSLVVEIHVALLNTIIRDRWLLKGKKRQIISRKAIVRTNSITNSIEEEDSDSEDDTYSSREILKKLEQKWDKKLISLNDGRKGWICVLIGCIQQLSVYESMPNLDHILLHLVSNKTLSEKDFEEKFAILKVQDKLQILSFLVNITAKTSVIHSQIENCVEKLTELNKEKNDNSITLDLICHYSSSSLTEISKGNIPSASSFEAANINGITPDNITANDLTAQKHKLEEEQAEIQQRAIIIYLNSICALYNFELLIEENYGTGRIFVEMPSAHDLEVMNEKEEQRFSKRRKVEESDSNLSSNEQAQWGYYEEASQIDELQRWLNTKGLRESALNNELTAYHQDITWGMIKRQEDLASSRTEQDLRRSRRTK